MENGSQITSLYKSISSLKGILNYETLAEVIPLSLHEAFGFERIFLFLPQLQGLRYAASYLASPAEGEARPGWPTEKLPSSLRDLIIRIDQNPRLKRSFREKKTFWQTEPQKTFTKEKDLKKLAKLLKFKSVILIPLVLADENLGLILVEEGEEERFKEASLLAILDTFADSAALALENAHLYGETLKTSGNYRTILEQMGDGILMVDPNHQISFYNEVAQELLGFPKEEMLGKEEHKVLNIFNLKGRRLSGEEECLIANMGRSGVFSGEALIETLGKGRLPVFLHARTIHNVKQEVVGTVLIFRDITKELELERTRREFVAMASHELRTPLTGIKGFLDMILEGDVGKISTKVRAHLMSAYESTERMIRLVEDLLTASRVERGKLEFRLQNIDLLPPVSEVATDLSEAAKRKGIFLKLESPPRKLPQIWADPDKLREILINIVGNAIKFTDEGEVTISFQTKGNSLITSVKDTGIGIAKKDQPHIFKRFYTVETTLARERHGTGLGLYIAKQLVEGMEGKIWLESGLGRGSTFSFSLPLAKSGSKSVKITSGTRNF